VTVGCKGLNGRCKGLGNSLWNKEEGIQSDRWV
jgi:hypothetical protein